MHAAFVTTSLNQLKARTIVSRVYLLFPRLLTRWTMVESDNTIVGQKKGTIPLPYHVTFYSKPSEACYEQYDRKPSEACYQ